MFMNMVSRNGRVDWLGAHSTREEAVAALNEWMDNNEDDNAELVVWTQPVEHFRTNI